MEILQEVIGVALAAGAIYGMYKFHMHLKSKKVSKKGDSNRDQPDQEQR